MELQQIDLLQVGEDNQDSFGALDWAVYDTGTPSRVCARTYATLWFVQMEKQTIAFSYTEYRMGLGC